MQVFCFTIVDCLSLSQLKALSRGALACADLRAGSADHFEVAVDQAYQLSLVQRQVGELQSCMCSCSSPEDKQRVDHKK